METGSANGAIEVVQAAYNLRGDSTTWAARVGRLAYDWLGGRCGGVVYPYRIEGGDVHLAGEVHVIDGPPEWSAVPSLLLASDDANGRLASHTRQFALASERYSKEQWSQVAPPPIVDGLAMQGLEAPVESADGLQIFLASDSVLSIPETVRERARMVSAHLGTAVRLRANLSRTNPLDRAAAVFESDGRVAHVEDEVEPALEELRERAVAAAARPKSGGESDLQRALEAWTALVSGRWSLLEHFDNDGRRFIVAIKNSPRVANPRALTARERQVVAYCAIGYAVKAIGYHLGLHATGVSRALSSALKKLGLKDRVELARTLGPLARVVYESEAHAQN